MYVVLHDALGNPQRIRCTSLVVYSDANQPVSAITELRPDLINAAHVDDPDFNTVLSQVSKLTVVRGAPSR